MVERDDRRTRAHLCIGSSRDDGDDVTTHERIERLARVLCVRPLPHLDVVRDPKSHAWWLVGHVGGDTALPGTRGARTLPEALDAAEAWFSPELASFESARKA